MNEKTQKILKKAMFLCSKAEKCESEIRQKLKQWAVAPEDVDEIVEYLIDGQFIDNQRYAKSFVHDKIIFNKWGKIKIAYNLQQKQISNNLITNAITEFDISEYENIANTVFRQKYKVLKATESDKNIIAQKLFSFAYSRGFEQELLQKFLAKTQNDDEELVVF